jgi:small subunit ribosomal protein S18
VNEEQVENPIEAEEPQSEQAPPATDEERPAEAAARPERRRPRYTSRRKVCFFCAEKAGIDYKDVDALRRYLSDRGKIEPRRKTGTCARHQRRLTIALKRARHLALLPYTADHLRTTGPSLNRA